MEELCGVTEDIAGADDAERIAHHAQAGAVGKELHGTDGPVRVPGFRGEGDVGGRDKHVAVFRPHEGNLGRLIGGCDVVVADGGLGSIAFADEVDRKSTRLNSSHGYISY